ncbi:MAG: hypothetical protein AB1468_02655 [Candidatus Micrarchaeota archaeon]
MRISEIGAAIFIALLALSVSTYYPSSYLSIDAYKHAVLLRESIGGGQRGELYAGLAYVYGFLGGKKEAVNNETIANVIRYTPMVLGALAAVLLFFALRSLFSDVVALLATALFITSNFFVRGTMGGVFVPEFISGALVVCGVSLFILAARTNFIILALLSAAFFAGGARAHPLGLYALAGFALACAAQFVYSRHEKKETGKFALSAVIVLALSIIASFGAQANLATSANIAAAANAYSFALPIAVVGVLYAVYNTYAHKRWKEGEFEFGVFVVVVAVSSIALSLAEPAAGMFGIYPAAALALASVMEIKEGSRTGRLVLPAAVFLLAFAVLWDGGVVKAGVTSLFLFGVAYFVQSLYSDAKVLKYVLFSLFALLLFTSIVAGVLASQNRPEFVDGRWAGALLWAKTGAEQGATLAGIGMEYPIMFIAEKNSVGADAEINEFLVGSGSADKLKAMGVGYIVVDGRELFDSAFASGGARIDSFRFAGYGLGDEGKTLYAVFNSSGGSELWAVADPQNGALVQDIDARLVDRQSSRAVSFRKLLKLFDWGCNCIADLSAPACRESCRYIYPRENFHVNAFEAFFSVSDRLENMYGENSSVRIFKVR